MKKLLLSLFMISLAFVFTSCDEDSTSPDPTTLKGSIAFTSTPVGAQIWKAGVNTNKVTPDSLTELAAGDYSITLKLENYKDTTFSVKVEGGKKTVVATTLTALPLILETYSNVKLFEIAATGFSGLDLSTGSAVSSTGALCDLFYNGGSGKDSLYSQHLRPPGSGVSARYTDIYTGSSTDLNDGVDAPAYSGTSGMWKSSMPSSVGNYRFLYDNEFYYSKLRVVSKGGGTGASDPYLWVEVTYKINKTVKDRRF